MATQPRLPQAMRPSGNVGRVLGWLMRRLNRPAYRWTVEQLRSAHPKSLLEIGFGTGDLLALAAKRLKLARVAGVDPSQLMLDMAKKRLRRFRKKAALYVGGAFKAFSLVKALRQIGMQVAMAGTQTGFMLL